LKSNLAPGYSKRRLHRRDWRPHRPSQPEPSCRGGGAYVPTEMLQLEIVLRGRQHQRISGRPRRQLRLPNGDRLFVKHRFLACRRRSNRCVHCSTARDRCVPRARMAPSASMSWRLARDFYLRCQELALSDSKEVPQTVSAQTKIAVQSKY
jgi:hypothetical protein